VGRRIRARRRQGGHSPRVRGHVGPASRPEAEVIPLPQAKGPRAVEPAAMEPDAMEPDAMEPRAAEAELDALRGALVRELDRLAAEDGCSASFRRAG
jgi:hypothetical protein